MRLVNTLRNKPEKDEAEKSQEVRVSNEAAEKMIHAFCDKLRLIKESLERL